MMVRTVILKKINYIKKKKEKQSCRNIVKVKVEVFFLVEEEEDPEGG